jgi:hypothetical protein
MSAFAFDHTEATFQVGGASQPTSHGVIIRNSGERYMLTQEAYCSNADTWAAACVLVNENNNPILDEDDYEIEGQVKWEQITLDDGTQPENADEACDWHKFEVYLD